MSVVLTELCDRILTVTVNRPEKPNALNAEMLEAFLETRPPRFTGR